MAILYLKCFLVILVLIVFKEDVLLNLSKGATSGFALANLISKGSKFRVLDIKRVYFGFVSFLLTPALMSKRSDYNL